MVNAKDFRKIYRYNREVLEKFCRRLERLPWSVVSKDREVTWHSMAGVFDHVVGVIDGWLNYVVQGARADESLANRSWDSLTSMREIRAHMKTVWRKVDPLLKELSDAQLRRKVRAPWQPKACTLEDALLQVTFEQAHHLGEIIAMLWQVDKSPPEMTWLWTNWNLAK
jgi:uncharacterized damage-inducible protein DinB